MKIKYIANASIFLEGKNTKVLFDPWITFDNHSDTNYYNFPENRYSKKEIADLNPDFIYISHSHPDHLDEITLNLFNKNTPIIIADFANAYLKRNLNDIGFNNILLSKDNRVQMNKNDFCYLEPAATTPELDSISFFQIDDYKIINLNDNVSNFEQSEWIAKKFGDIDLAFLPYCGFGPYPMSYDSLDKNQKIKAHKEKVIKAHDNFVKYIEKINPDYVIPFAGEVLMGGPAKAPVYRYDGSGIGKKQDCVDNAKKKLDFNCVLMSPGCAFDFTQKKFSGKFIDNDFKENEKYLLEISEKRGQFEKGGGFHISEKFQVNLTRSLQKALLNLSQSRLKRELPIPKRRVFLDIAEQDHLYELDLNNDKVVKFLKTENLGEEFEIFKMNYSMLVALLTRHVTWSNIEEDIHYYRKPDIHDSNLEFLMNFLAL